MKDQRKNSNIHSIRALLPMREISTHQSFKQPPFVPDTYNSPIMLKVDRQSEIESIRFQGNTFTVILESPLYCAVRTR
jgi:hypothetical protein